MSYILTALRKSEAERAKGMVPRLSTRHEFEALPARRRLLWPSVAVATLIFNSLLVAFVLWNPAILPWPVGQQTGPAEASSTETAPEPVPEAKMAAASIVRTDGASGGLEETGRVEPANGTSRQNEPQVQAAQSAVSHTALQSTSKAPDYQNGTAVRSTSQLARNNSTDGVLVPAAAPVEAGTDTAGSGTSIPATPTRAAAAPPTPTVKEPQQVQIATAAPEPPTPKKKAVKTVQKAAAKKPATQIALAPPEASAEAVNSEAEAADPYGDVPELWRMPRDFRSRVPKFSISVHVYAPENDHRFIIVDRKKFGEGDRLKSGVMVEAILPDGVVFQVNGEQFKLTSG